MDTAGFVPKDSAMVREGGARMGATYRQGRAFVHGSGNIDRAVLISIVATRFLDVQMLSFALGAVSHPKAEVEKGNRGEG